MNWFEEWFNFPYYHLLYNNRNENEAELFITKIAEFLKITPPASVLDVACGKGRHAKTLAQLGLQVTGIDLSENSIAEAKKFSSPNLRFDVWDMRQPYRTGEYQVVFNLFSSFGYFETEQEDAACIRAFYQNLQAGGVLILDYINTEYAVKKMKAREIIPRENIQFHIQKRIEKGFIKKKIEFLAAGENYSFEEQLKVINRYQFMKMLEHAGFSITHTFGDYELQPFVAASSPRLILVAKK